MIRYPSSGYDPNFVKPENLAACTVCGWAGIDLILWSSGVEIAPISFETDIGCHSPNFDGGSAPDLKW
jgi:hypothetical protein